MCDQTCYRLESFQMHARVVILRIGQGLHPVPFSFTFCHHLNRYHLFVGIGQLLWKRGETVGIGFDCGLQS